MPSLRGDHVIVMWGWRERAGVFQTECTGLVRTDDKLCWPRQVRNNIVNIFSWKIQACIATQVKMFIHIKFEFIQQYKIKTYDELQ